ncbi:hypothetical protein ABIF00_006064 [Bradyrhizobium elkanii]
MHRRQAADIDEVADLAVAAERRRRREDHAIADHAVMADMAVVHEEAAIADAGEPAALDRADVHRHALADGAGFADFEAGRLAAIAEILRRPAERRERRDDAAGADPGMPADRDMRDQLAVLAKHDIGADDAVRTDLGAGPDHSAIGNPRSRVDHAHEVSVRNSLMAPRCYRGARLSIGAVVSATLPALSSDV